jgi:structural maintenance of chromosome 2
MTEAHKFNKDQYASLEADVTKSEELLQTLLTGVTSKQDKTNTGGGYMGQLAEAKAQLAQGKAEEEQSKVKLGMREKELQELKKRMKEFEREAGEGQKKLKDMNAVVERMKAKLGKCRWNQEVEEQLETKLRVLRQRVRELMDVRCFPFFPSLHLMFTLFFLETGTHQTEFTSFEFRIFGSISGVRS